MDENDKLRAGILPTDPTADAKPYTPRSAPKRTRRRARPDANARGADADGKTQTSASTRARIMIGPDLHRVIDEAIQALAPHAIFQRQGQLVDVVRGATTKADGVVRADGTPRIRMLPNARLHELLTTACDFHKATRENGKPTLRSVSPPAMIASTLDARGQWDHIRPLGGIAEWPLLRADGSILCTPGYDWRTGLIFEPTVTVALPPSPTHEDAREALKVLHDLVSDFPFAHPAHRSAFLASLLTVLARPAIDGPTPLTLIDANLRGAGKTLLADVIGVIVSGRALPRGTASEDPAEWKKALLAIAIAADPIVLFDNVTRMLKSDALDAVLTGTQFRERVLGRNQQLTLDVRTCFVATSNNATLSADLVRRSLHVRLDARTERPEQRAGFKHDPLLEHARTERAKYLGAGLTILRAYFEAGQPSVTMRPMGSYDAWSRVVRAALVWAGEPDPAETQDGLREGSDPEADVLRELVPAWHRAYSGRAVSLRTVLQDLGAAHLRPEQLALRDAIAVLCDSDAGKLPTARRLGSRLRRVRGNIVEGLLFERIPGHHEDGARWQTRSVNPDCAESADCDLEPPSIQTPANSVPGNSQDGQHSQPWRITLSEDGEVIQC